MKKKQLDIKEAARPPIYIRRIHKSTYVVRSKVLVTWCGTARQRRQGYKQDRDPLKGSSLMPVSSYW
jgi:hypothetical protein